MRQGFTERVDAAFAALPADARECRPSIGIILGAAVMALARREFKCRFPSVRKALRRMPPLSTASAAWHIMS